MAGPIIIPAPVVIPAGDGGNVDIPTGYVVAYTAIALLVWAIASVATARRMDSDGSVEDVGMAVFIGALTGLLWPLALLAAPITVLVLRMGRR
jgi:hypothetical protein